MTKPKPKKWGKWEGTQPLSQKLPLGLLLLVNEAKPHIRPEYFRGAIRKNVSRRLVRNQVPAEVRQIALAAKPCIKDHHWPVEELDRVWGGKPYTLEELKGYRIVLK